MEENLFMPLYLLFIFLIILFIEIIMPRLTRKEIVFGVRVPQDKTNLKEIKDIKKKYIINNLIIGVPVIILFTFLNYKFSSTGMILFTTFGFMFIYYLIYIMSNRAVKNLKQQQNWFEGKKQSVTIDTNFSREKINTIISPWFFIIPVIMIVINIILGYKYYSSLPNRVPIHWDFSGNITGYSHKSIFLIWDMPLVQTFITFIFFIVYKGIGWSKQQISSFNPKSSVEKNKIFRRVWSIYMTVFCILINCMLTMGTLQRYNVFHISSKLYTIVSIAFLVLVFCSIIIISIKLGQGGVNVKLPGKEEKNEFSSRDNDDDSYWKFGMIYYNRNDPSIFVEKRFGIGWTVNAGSLVGMAIYIGIIVLIIISLIAPKIFK